MKYYWLAASLLLAEIIHAQNEQEWLLETGITFNHYQAQVKAEVGDPRGERLTNNYEIGINIIGSYKWNEWLATGIFVRGDIGQREMALFDGFDESGKTTTKGNVGGTYSELWIGPIIQTYWKQLALELGYGVIGLRKDNGRDDIPNSAGETNGIFTLNPLIAWLVNIGWYIPISNNFDVSLKVEYRGRYYLERGGKELLNDIDHGTQSIVPVLGVRWHIQ